MPPSHVQPPLYRPRPRAALWTTPCRAWSSTPTTQPPCMAFGAPTSPLQPASPSPQVPPVRGGAGRAGAKGLLSIFSSHPLPGLEGPRDLEAKEVTPRTALLTWTEPQVLPTGYLLTYDTPDGQTQVPTPAHWPRPSLVPFQGLPLPDPPVGLRLRVPDPPFSVPQEILLPGSATSHQLLGLFPSTTYRAWLRAVWGEGLTPPMSTSFTTGAWGGAWGRGCVGSRGLGFGSRTDPPCAPAPRWTAGPLPPGLWGGDAERGGHLQNHHHLPQWRPSAPAGRVL